MPKIFLTFIIITLLTACKPPPLCPKQLDGIEYGQSRNQVLKILNHRPDQIVHATLYGTDYIAYYYQLQTGTKNSTKCKTRFSCAQTPKPITTPYLFIFKNANQPKLKYYGSLESLEQSPYVTERHLIRLLQTMNIQPFTRVE